MTIFVVGWGNVVARKLELVIHPPGLVRTPLILRFGVQIVGKICYQPAMIHT